jgi:hypothetical protein
MRRLPTFHVKGEPAVLQDHAICRQSQYFIYRSRIQILYVIAKLQEKEKFVVFKPKLNIPLRERTKVVHNPEEKSLIFLCLRLRNIHTAAFPFNISGIWHRLVINLREGKLGDLDFHNLRLFT